MTHCFIQWLQIRTGPTLGVPPAIPSYVCVSLLSVFALFSAAFHPAFNSAASPLQPCTHSVFKSKETLPLSRKLLVPLHILSPSLPPPRSPSPACLDRSKWCDCDCSAGRLPLSVFGKSDAGRQAGREGKGRRGGGVEGWRVVEREKAERRRERWNGLEWRGWGGGGLFEQQGMAALQRESGVSPSGVRLGRGSSSLLLLLSQPSF